MCESAFQVEFTIFALDQFNLPLTLEAEADTNC